MKCSLAIVLIILVSQICTYSQVANHLVIAELYGGGGDQGSYWTNDYIALYNPMTNSVDLSNWSIQYAKFNDYVWEVTTLTGSIQPNGYYIVQEGGGVWVVLPLPFTANAIGVIDMDKNKGKIALLNSQTALTVSNPIGEPNVIDFIGWGNGTNAYEGTGPAPQLGLTSGLRRKDNNGNNTYGINGNGWDSNYNYGDFYVETDLINNPPLPVELSSFTATINEIGVLLKWTTETEVNNYGFQIQKSVDRSQELEWNAIGFVQGNGNSNSPKEYSFIDENIIGGKYSYRLKQFDTDGKFEYSKVIEVDLGSPQMFELSQNYPNPFNPATTINFTIPNSCHTKLVVFNLLGEEIATLVNEFKEAGKHVINFRAENLNSGLYIYKLEAGRFTQSRKMILLR